MALNLSQALRRADIRDLERFEARFWSRVEKSTGCWVWTGSAPRYGKVGIYAPSRKVERGHRVAYALVFGGVPAEAHVLHACDNPICVRPTHLFLGTVAINMLDKTLKGRGWSKLTAAQVIEIRALYRPRVTPYPELARRYGVHESTIARIVRGEGWEHLR